MTQHFFPGMMVLMCWDFIDFNKTRLSAARWCWTTDDAKGEEEEDRVVNIIAFFSVVGGKRVSCACRRARVSLLCSEEEREHSNGTQDLPLTLATLNTRKRKREEFYRRFWERHGETKDAKKESPPEKHPTLLFTAVVVSFFVLLLFVRRLT